MEHKHIDCDKFGKGKCHLCDVELTSADHAAQHIAGRRHQQLLSKVAEKENPRQWARTKETWCEVCQKPFTGIQSAKQHYGSAKHTKNVEESKWKNQLNFEKQHQDDMPNSSEGASYIDKPTCNITVSDKHQTESETDGIANSTYVEDLLGESESKKQPHTNTLPDLVFSGTCRIKSPNYWCEICNVPFSGMLNAQEHYAGKPHKRKLLNNSKLNPEKENYTTGPIAVSGELADSRSLDLLGTYANDNSSKIDLATLKSCDPHVKNNSEHSGSDTSPETKENVDMADDFCGVCHTKFSSPDNAVAHYNGKKHRNTLKLYQFDSNKLKSCQVLYQDEMKKASEVLKLGDGEEKCEILNQSYQEKSIEKDIYIPNERHETKQVDCKPKLAKENDSHASGIEMDSDCFSKHNKVDEELKSCIDDFYSVLNSKSKPDVSSAKKEEEATLTDKSETLSSPNRSEKSDMLKQCPACNVQFSSPFNAKQHYEGKPHKKRLDFFKVTDQNNPALKLSYIVTDYLDVESEKSGFPIELLDTSIAKVDIVAAKIPLKEHKSCPRVDSQSDKPGINNN